MDRASVNSHRSYLHDNTPESAYRGYRQTNSWPIMSVQTLLMYEYNIHSFPLGSGRMAAF